MKIFMCISSLLLLLFPYMNSPISLGGILILLSFCFVSMMSLSSVWWYSYVLFLVYIGGLLVMFIYVCLVSSNQSFSSSISLGGLLICSSVLSYLMSLKPLSKSFLGSGLFEASSSLVNETLLWLFLGLVILLLLMMLVVVRSSGSGTINIK